MTALKSEALESSTNEASNNLATVSEVENEIRDFVRNDVAYLRRPSSASASTSPASSTTASTTPSSNASFSSTLAPTATPEAAVGQVNSLIQRVAGQSLTEIDNLLNELDELRSFLHDEGQRVQREIAGYAQLSQQAMRSTRMISDTMSQWKTSLDRGPAS